MNRTFDPPMTEKEERLLSLHYIYHQLARKNHENTKYAPQWVRTATQQDRFIVLNTGCDCMSEHHDLNVGVEYDAENKQPVITFWAKMCCSHDTFDAWSMAFDKRKNKIGDRYFTRWDDFVVWVTKWPGVAQIMWQRLKDACRLFFTGHHEWHGGTTFKDEKHLEDLHLALWWAEQKVMDNTYDDPENDNRAEYNAQIDAIVNGALATAGFELPPDSVAPYKDWKEWAGKNSEDIFRYLECSCRRPSNEDDDIPVAPV